MSKFVMGVVTNTYSDGFVAASSSDGSSASKKTILTSVPDGTGGSTAVKLSTDPRAIPIDDVSTLIDNYNYGSSSVGVGLYGIFNPAGISPVPSAPPLWQQIQTAKTANSTDAANQVWTAANPYGALQKDEKMYLSDYDNGKIFRYTTTANAYSEDVFGSNPYYFAPTLPTGATRAGAMGMDVQANGMVAAFTFYGVSGWNYTYQPSGLYLLPVNNTATASVSALASTTCTKNVNGTTVHGDFVYTTAFGGMQKAGGNAQDPSDPTAPISTLEVFKINASGTGFLPSFHKKITPAMLPDTSGDDYTVHFGTAGDFLGVEIVPVDGNNRAIMLLAHYDTNYTKYDYELLSVAESVLQAGTLNGAICVTGTVSPAGASWGLLKDDNNDLYLVDGVHIKKINPSDLSMTTVCSASDFTSDGTSSGTAGGLLNTAGIAIHASAGMLRGAPGAHVSVTKMAHRLITPEELKKRQKK
jgi:hypothetical protein